ncbi:MAG: YraN family protein [Bacteroidales bacterium]|nr:YraN family protein [Bacteroidales bacterium]
MKSKTELGKEAEKIAAQYLIRKGYELVAMNWHMCHREIDIIAWDQEMLVIVEVKLRYSDSYGHPSEFVSRQKQRFLIEAAEAYLETIDSMPEVRFDVVAILGEKDSFTLEHIEDAFNADP